MSHEEVASNDNKLNSSINQDQSKKQAKFDTDKYAKLTTDKYTPSSDKYNFNMSVVDQWVEIRTKKIPSRRAFHSAWILDDYFYIFGGLDIIQGKLNDFHRVLLADEVPKWEIIDTKGDQLPKLAYAVSVQYKSEFYIIGGQNVNLEQLSTFYKFNPTTNEVVKIEPLDFPQVENHCGTIHENGIYIFGGFSKGKHLNSLHFYNPETRSVKLIETDESPCARINSAIEIYQDSIYLFGGKDSDGKYLNDLWIFDIKKSKWSEITKDSKLTDIPKGRSGHTLTLFKENLYVFGGKSGNIHENNDFWKFDIKKQQFEIIQDNLLELHTQDQDRNDRLTARKSVIATNTKKLFPSAINKLNMEKQAALDKKAKLFEEYLFSCFPPAFLMNSSNIYEMDSDHPHFKKVMSTLTNKSNEMNFVSIVGKVPFPRDGHSALVYRQFLVVFGGDRNKFPFNDLYTFMY